MRAPDIRAVRRARWPILTASVLIVSVAAGESPASAQAVRQLTNDLTVAAGPGSMDDAGASVFTGSTANTTGTNPEHASQLVAFDVASLAETALTTADDGVLPFVSVSDDGVWIAFTSPSDLLGGNHDQSAELFVMTSAGTNLAQLTDDPSVVAGSVSQAVISGDGTRVAFVSNSDPLGTNPSHVQQVFIVDRTGTSLAQLTTLADDGIGSLGISDDAARIVFSHAGDPLGSNADLSSEIFAIDAAGTTLRQLTSTAATFSSSAPVISGDGSTVAFQSSGDLTGGNPLNRTEIFAIQWNGTGLTQVTTTTVIFGFTGDPLAAAPTITDDGQTIFFYSNFSSFSQNFDANFEIFSIASNGTNRQQITSSFLQVGSVAPVVSGSGNRLTYITVDAAVRLIVDDAAGGNPRGLVTYSTILNAQPRMTPDGSRVVYVRSPTLFGGDQVWRVQADGSDIAQVTSLASGAAATPSVAGDNSTIVFSADSDPDGSNADLSREIFAIQADGTGLVRLTSGPAGTSSQRPVIAADGSLVVFDSDADLTGTNADLSRELFAVLPDGTGLVQLTSGLAGTFSRAAAVDATGTWVAFESTADPLGTNADGTWEIFRMRTDGTSLAQLTADGTLNSFRPDIDAGGTRVVFDSVADHAGTNPDANAEVFVWNAAGGTISQLTSYAAGQSTDARISGDGTVVYLVSSAPVFEDDPDGPVSLFAIPSGGGAIRRVSALGLGAPGAADPSDDGRRAAYSGGGDETGQNRDALPEIWALDRDAAPAIDVGQGAPTLLSWTPNSGPIRYDVIRGDVANLSFAVVSQVDLGPVACLEDDSPDADTAGFEDALQPLPGQALFYVYRGSEGLGALGASYGTASNMIERIPASGDCSQ